MEFSWLKLVFLWVAVAYISILAAISCTGHLDCIINSIPDVAWRHYTGSNVSQHGYLAYDISLAQLSLWTRALQHSKTVSAPHRQQFSYYWIELKLNRSSLITGNILYTRMSIQSFPAIEFGNGTISCPTMIGIASADDEFRQACGSTPMIPLRNTSETVPFALMYG